MLLANEPHTYCKNQTLPLWPYPCPLSHQQFTVTVESMRGLASNTRGAGLGQQNGVQRGCRAPVRPFAPANSRSSRMTAQAHGANLAAFGKAVASINRKPYRPSRKSVVKAMAFFGKMFKSDPGEATRKKYSNTVASVSALEPTMQALSDDQLRAKTEEFKRRVQGGESLESVLVEAFAVSA